MSDAKSPPCQRCASEDTSYYQHPYEGGFHIGVWCPRCCAPALTGRTWYSHAAFKPEDIDAMPVMADTAQLTAAPNPKQGSLF